MTRPIPKQRRKTPRAVDQGEYDNVRDLSDVRSVLEQLSEISSHVQEAWFNDEVTRALIALNDARFALIKFDLLASAHYDRVIASTEQ